MTTSLFVSSANKASICSGVSQAGDAFSDETPKPLK